MLKETIRKLHDDVGRLQVAGAHLCAGDPELQKDHAALSALAAQLGAKAPAIAKLAETVQAALGAPSKEASAKLLDVAMMTSQVRSAQASIAAIEEALQPLEGVPELGTPCNAKDIYEVRDALLVKGEGRMPKVEAAIERRDIADLRLVEAVVRAMGDPWIGEKVTTDAVPLLGKAVIVPIRKKLNVKGNIVDGRRLRATVAVEGAAARDLLEKGVKEGTPEVREAALDAIADYVPGVKEFEPLVLDLVAKDKSADVKRAAVRALRGYASDASLEALLTYFETAGKEKGGKWKWRNAAIEALGESKHPKVVDRLLEKLDAAVAAVPKKGKKDEEPILVVKGLLNALAPHEDPRIAERAIELVGSYGEPAAKAVVKSGDDKQLKQLADALSGSDSELFVTAVSAALKLGADEPFKRLSAVFTAKDRDGKNGLLRISAVLEALDAGADKRWSPVLLKALGDDAKIAAQAARALGTMKEKAAVKPLIKLVESSKSTDLVRSAIAALGDIGDSAALDPLIKKLEGNSYGWVVRNAILEINDPSSVDKVRTVVAALKNPDDYKHWYLKHLLNSLENRFPGH